MLRLLSALLFGSRAGGAALPTAERYWVETRLRWLAERFGLERMRSVKVATPDDFLSDLDLEGDDRDVRRILGRIEKFLERPVGRIPVEVIDDARLPDAVGHYDRTKNPIIRVRRSLVSELLPLVATLAHELMHDILLGDGHLTGDEQDHEQTTDLATVFFGLGIFPANSTIRFESTRAGNWESWSISRQGYLPSRVFGYALGLFAAWRNEVRPAWARQLRLDAATTFSRTSRHLRSASDCLFHPAAQDPRCETWSVEKIIEMLDRGSPTFRYAALERIMQTFPADPRLAPAVARMLRQRDLDVIIAATRTLGNLQICDDRLLRELVDMLFHRSKQVRIAAADSISRLRAKPDEALSELARLMFDSDVELAEAAVEALGTYKQQARPYVKQVLKVHRSALVDTHYGLEQAAVGALSRAVDDPRATLRQYYAGQDEELLERAMQSFEERQVVLREETPRNRLTS